MHSNELKKSEKIYKKSANRRFFYNMQKYLLALPVFST